MPPPPDPDSPLREAVEDITRQLRKAVDGDFRFSVHTDVQDEASDQLVILVNFVLDAARRAVAEAEERNERIRERSAELEQFAYVASHDLQEPLRMVSSFLQLLQRRYEGELDQKADEYIAYAVDGSKRMQRLIQDLLAFSRVGSDARALEPVDMEEVVEEVRQGLGPAIVEAGARLAIGDLPVVRGDRRQLVQLFQHLLGNALKFRGEGPLEVRIAAHAKRDRWRFQVSDNGIGIAEEHQERIFQIFQRLHTRDEYEGTGIGLAISKRIVERHGGELSVESAPGEGATFWFTLPRAQGEGGGGE